MVFTWSLCLPPFYSHLNTLPTKFLLQRWMSNTLSSVFIALGPLTSLDMADGLLFPCNSVFLVSLKCHICCLLLLTSLFLDHHGDDTTSPCAFNLLAEAFSSCSWTKNRPNQSHYLYPFISALIHTWHSHLLTYMLTFHGVVCHSPVAPLEIMIVDIYWWPAMC